MLAVWESRRESVQLVSKLRASVYYKKLYILQKVEMQAYKMVHLENLEFLKITTNNPSVNRDLKSFGV